MFEIVFLGTSASAPSIQRGLSAQIVMYKDYRFLVDCGEGTQRQILRSGLGFRRLDKILITHGHLDHILGLGGLVSTVTRWGAGERIEIWGGRWALDRVSDLIFGVVLRGARPPVDIDLYDIEGPSVLMEDDTFQLSAFPVDHRGPDCYGYTFEQKSRRPFLNEKAEALGVPRGPERRDLVNGKSVKLADGRVIQPEDVLGDEIPGVKICLTGDVGRPDSLREWVHGADLLVSEATYLQEDVDLAKAHGHVTARQMAQLAKEEDTKNLLLTHVSRRYRERDIIDEARTVFPDTRVVRDFDHYRIRRDEPIERVEND